MFIGWNEKLGSIPVGNVCHFARFYIKSLRDLGNLPYSAYKHIFPPGVFWWRLDSYIAIIYPSPFLCAEYRLPSIPLLWKQILG